MRLTTITNTGGGGAGASGTKFDTKRLVPLFPLLMGWLYLSWKGDLIKDSWPLLGYFDDILVGILAVMVSVTLWKKKPK